MKKSCPHHFNHTYSRTSFSERDLCYVAALFEALRLIDAKAKELHTELDEVNPFALQTYVKNKGDYLVFLMGEENAQPRKTLVAGCSTPNIQRSIEEGRKAA